MTKIRSQYKLGCENKYLYYFKQDENKTKKKKSRRQN